MTVIIRLFSSLSPSLFPLFMTTNNEHRTSNIQIFGMDFVIDNCYKYYIKKEFRDESMLRVIIADDHDIVRQGLFYLINRQEGLKVVSEAGTAGDLLKKCRSVGHDMIVSDLSMPDKDGFDMIKEIKLLNPAIPLLIVSMHNEDNYALRALKAGADGYINKDAESSKIIEAIRIVASGKKFIPPRVSQIIFNEYLTNSTRKEPVELLTEREFQVMVLIARGKSTVEIGSDLNLSIKTIGTYRANIMSKLKLKNDIEIYKFAERNGLHDF